MKRKRLVDCSVTCAKSGRHDFNVRPKRSESDNEACLRRAKDFAPGNHCTILRARAIDGIKPRIRFMSGRGKKVGRIIREA